MSERITVKTAALEPLFGAWEEPNRHRVKAEDGAGAEIRKGRRPSGIAIAQNLRAEVKAWRESHYPGASDTTRHLLAHWFGRSHSGAMPGGEAFEFRYYFCQREAIETLIYVKEVRGLDCLSQLTAEFGGLGAAIAALGITDEEDQWGRYAFKMATGSGKTKVMSLAIVWSYFHALRESDSTMARHFVLVAPNLTVFERLKEDFKPEGGGGNIFDKDPLIPVEWRGDWNFSVVLQDEAGGVSVGGTLYLTNIHRLYNPGRKRDSQADEYDFMGPKVSKTKALDTGAALRDRITAHERVMILNDEAHHVWDPDSAWNEAIATLHEAIRKRTGGGLAAQLDFSATPKDNRANYFKHIICDSPLGEAVDAGIVKTPIIGRAGQLIERASDNAADKFEVHLKLGYERWLRSKDEWEKSGKKPLLFVMCEDTTAADEIAGRLNTSEAFAQLNGKTLNLHTRLKGRVKNIGRGSAKTTVFVEADKEISDEDLKELRKLSRDLDSGTSPYHCIVSVLMLREGWDVRNVTTIVPLRPYTSKANILPEQTLGRGLRRMTPPGQANEVVAVVEHEAFARLYQEELAQEGLPVEVVDVDKVPATTVSIFPDFKGKNVDALEIAVPRLTAANVTIATLGPITEAEIREVFSAYRPLPLAGKSSEQVEYEGKHLITGEVIERMKVNLALLESGVGAVSFYVQELEYLCKVKGTHQVLAPLLQKFFEEILFDTPVSLFDERLIRRLSHSDVREHVRATFYPLIRAKTQQHRIRTPESEPMRLSEWRPFQVTINEHRPVCPASRTLFNLVACNRQLERSLVDFMERAPDVAAFAKNAGPQCLRIDYLAGGRRLAFYTPDFFIRDAKGSYFLVEAKGQVDQDVPAKARAAVEWCRSASQTGGVEWRYLYVPEEVFERYSGDKLEGLVRACHPALRDLLESVQTEDEAPWFDEDRKARPAKTNALCDPGLLEGLPPKARRAVEDAMDLYQFLVKKESASFSPVFTALLGVMDDAARTMIKRRLTKFIPPNMLEQQDWFEPYLEKVDSRQRRHFNEMATNLKKTLVFNRGLSPIGLLRNCLDYALNSKLALGGVFDVVAKVFKIQDGDKLLEGITKVNDLRNTKIAHQEGEFSDGTVALEALGVWVRCLALLTK